MHHGSGMQVLQATLRGLNYHNLSILKTTHQYLIREVLDVRTVEAAGCQETLKIRSHEFCNKVAEGNRSARIDLNYGTRTYGRMFEKRKYYKDEQS